MFVVHKRMDLVDGKAEDSSAGGSVSNGEDVEDHTDKVEDHTDKIEDHDHKVQEHHHKHKVEVGKVLVDVDLHKVVEDYKGQDEDYKDKVEEVLLDDDTRVKEEGGVEDTRKVEVGWKKEKIYAGNEMEEQDAPSPGGGRASTTTRSSTLSTTSGPGSESMKKQIKNLPISLGN